MILLSLFVTTFAVMVATSSAIELRGGLLRTTELLQEDSVLTYTYSDCVKDCTDYFNGKWTDWAAPNTRNAPNWCHDQKEIYGADFNKCMQDFKEWLESIGSKNGFVGAWCTQRICKGYLPGDGSVGVE